MSFAASSSSSSSSAGPLSRPIPFRPLLIPREEAESIPLLLTAGWGEGDFDPEASLNDYQRGKLQRMRDGIHEWEDLTEEELRWLDTMTLLRYLRARDWKLKNSLPMLRATIEWRREYRPTEITPSMVEHESESGKNYRRGFDKFGRPVLWMTPSRENTETSEDQIRLVVYNIERCIEVMDISRGVEQIVLVIDQTDFSMKSSPPLSQSRRVLSILSDHYPERLGKAILVNAPWYFNMFWTLVKPFINSNTKKKIEFMKGGTAPGEKLHKALTAYFDMDTQCEARFGGGDPFDYDHSIHWPEEIARYKAFNLYKDE